MLNPMVDNFDRKISYMRISITDRCNLRCTYCIPAWGYDRLGKENHLTYDEILRVVSGAARRGLYKVRVTGGEPLVREGVAGFVEDLCHIPGIREIAMTTNGVLLKKYASPLRKAGLQGLNISLDSLDPDRFRQITRGHAFWKVWEGIEEAEQCGFNPIKLNVVLQKGVNEDESLEFAKLTFKKSYHVRFIEYMPAGDYADWKTRFMPLSEIKERISKDLGMLYPTVRSDSDGPSVNFRFEDAQGVLGFISAISNPHFCNQCNRMRLTADGMIRPCLFSNIGVDLREALHRHCDNEELDGLLDQALGIKPQSHELGRFSEEKTLKAMVGIGG